jgi:peptide-methionine (S)-S-oxide reductase
MLGIGHGRLGIGAFKQRLPRPEEALPGREAPLPLHNVHFVNGRPLRGDFAGLDVLDVGLGCFWGAERKFWQLPGVVTTAVGYQGGLTPNPTYEEVCSGLTGHTEVVRVVFDPAQVALDTVLRTFWENHDPTQGMRQGNDTGTQYR